MLVQEETKMSKEKVTQDQETHKVVIKVRNDQLGKKVRPAAGLGGTQAGDEDI